MTTKPAKKVVRRLRPPQRKRLGLMRILSVPGCGLPLALIHHDAQLPLTRFLSGERYRLGDKPPNRRVLGMAITWRIPQPDREADYFAHALYDDGELVEIPLTAELGGMLHAVMWCKTPTNADADKALAARIEELVKQRQVAEKAAGEARLVASNARAESQTALDEKAQLAAEVTRLRTRVADEEADKWRMLERAQVAEAARDRLAAELAGLQQLLASPSASSSLVFRPPATAPTRGAQPDPVRPGTGRAEAAGSVSRANTPRPGSTPSAPAPEPPSRFSLLEVD